MSKSVITLGSLFDGIGGFPYAGSFYGITPLWASEILPEAVSVTRRHFPDMEHFGDITKIYGGELPPVDIVTFGSPCQGLAICGRRLGLADERSALFTEAIRIIHEMQEATNHEYPKFAIWENVPHAAASAQGRDFKTVLEAFTEAEIPMPVSGRWANAGMVRGGGIDLAWVMYASQHFGTAQRRRRLFAVCDFRGKRAGKVLFVPKSLRGYYEAGGTPRQGLTAFTADGAGAADRKAESDVTLPPLCMGTGQSNTAIYEDAVPTLTHSHEHPIIVHPDLAGTLCASGAGLSRPAGQGNELDFCIVSAGFKHKASAAAGSVGYQEELAPTLLAGQQSSVVSEVYGKITLRRLSPTEAERLMGFRDGWTEYGYDGRKISDTKRYQMLGNSICVPCVAYIMQGIRDVWNDVGEDKEE